MVLALATAVGVLTSTGAQAQTVSTNMPGVTEATSFVNSGVGLAALAITASIVIALGWKVFRAARKVKV